MKPKPGTLLSILALLSALLMGCQQAARHSAQVRPPAQIPTPRPDPGPLPIITQVQIPRLTPSTRPVADILIDRVEAAYQAGQEDYKANRIERARQDFNHAVDLLLTSGMDFNSDSRLEPLFDRILDTIHGYELAAETEGEAYVEPKAEPAPLEEIADVNLPADMRLKEKAAPELLSIPHDLPLTLNDPILSYLNFFQTRRGRAIVERGLRRAGSYRGMIQRILLEEGVPSDLIYLAQAESAFQPLAVSRAGARGIWQFMPYRAQEYGLQRNRWIDERLDPEKSTRAAARHLRDLYQMFGDWYLAMAAYDSGPLNVARGIERTGYADFWELYRRNALPKETRNYVPIIIALTLIAKDPARYAIAVSDPDQPELLDRISLTHPVDLRLVADCLNTSVDTLRTLNPELLRLVTPDQPGFEIRLPAGTAQAFHSEVGAIPQERWVGWRRHRVTEGETLAAIAFRYRVKPAALASANDLGPRPSVQPGDLLLVPSPLPVATRLVRYRVRRGDSLESIAARFEVSIAELKRWNHLGDRHPPVGSTLRVYAGGTPPVAASRVRTSSPAPRGRIESVAENRSGGQPNYHRVTAGETLWSIAQANHTSVAALKAQNPFLNKRGLQVGDRLAISPER